MKKVLTVLIGVLPFNSVRIFFWRYIFKYKIDFGSSIGWGNIICCNSVRIKSAVIGHFNRIFCNDLQMDENSEIRKLNNIKMVNKFHMRKDSKLVSRNSFVGLYLQDYKYKEDCNILIGEKSIVTINNSFDATRHITVGNNVVFGGKGSQLWTHGFDIYRNMVTGPVTIGNDIYVGSGCIILQTVNICDKTSIGAGTCVSKSITEPGFYISNQLIRKSDIKRYRESDF